jgi:membrane-associated phospholipid phosphatase
MVAQGYHYFTDTIAGAGVGAGTVLTGALLIDGAAGRLHTRVVLSGTVADDSWPGLRR